LTKCPVCYLEPGVQSGGAIINGFCWDCVNPACESCRLNWSSHVEPGRFPQACRTFALDGHPAPEGLSKERWNCVQALMFCPTARSEGRCQHRGQA
jgi:hypothetical protein